MTLATFNYGTNVYRLELHCLRRLAISLLPSLTSIFQRSYGPCFHSFSLRLKLLGLWYLDFFVNLSSVYEAEICHLVFFFVKVFVPNGGFRI